MESIEQYYRDLQAEDRRLLEQRRTECFARCPELAALQAQKGEAFRLPLAEGRVLLQSLAKRQRELLLSLQLPENYLDMPYTCPLCKDTGYTGKDVAVKCACRIKREQLSLRAEARIGTRETFSAFRTDIYADEAERIRGEKIRAACLKFAEALPKPEKPQLLFFGMAGLGKSFFGNAMAAFAADKGIESRRITAYALLHEVTEGFARNSDAVSVYSRIPFLVLDDLGTEAMIPNVTQNALFSLIDRRLLEELPTVYITNLLPEELQLRYGERISSRLMQKSATVAIRFTGTNLRGR